MKYFLKFIHDKVFGWQQIGRVSNCKKALIFSYPHTSYWDGFYILLLSMFYNGFLVFKDEDWIGAIGIFFGHIVIKRNSKQGHTDQIAEKIKQHNNIWLFMSPEGTTNLNDHIKSGFYYIAVKADIPIICANYNYQTSQYCFSHPIEVKRNGEVRPMKDVLEDISYFYKVNKLFNSGKFIEKQTPLKIKKVI